MPELPECKGWKYRLMNEVTEPIPDNYEPNKWDVSRAQSLEDIEYLLRPHHAGEVHVASRGKQLVIAAGHHAMVIRFGLEANVIKFTRKDFDEITSVCIPGPNKNPAKAQKLRRFAIPDHLCSAYSSTGTRSLTIFAAVVCEDDVWAVLDFGRLVQLHIISRDDVWTETDLQVNSETWNSIWTCYPDYGPDWIDETAKSLEQVDIWRSEVLNGIGHKKAIVDVLADNKMAFNGLGRHLANDLLHELAIFPGTPALALCENEDEYQAFRRGIHPYLSQFASEEFLQKTSTEVNSTNYLDFNTTSNRYYLGSFLKVYRREMVRVPAKLYNKLKSNGLLDENHTISHPYTLKDKSELCPSGTYKILPVYQYLKPLEAYSVITAKCPDDKHWITGPRGLATDVRHEGYKTCIGLADFREYKWNQLDPARALNEITFKRGRKVKERTGLPGRPRAPLTKQRLQKMAKPKEQIVVSKVKMEVKENGLALPTSPPRKRTRSQTSHANVVASIANSETSHKKRKT
ncbi:hypothetical protein HWV62_26883 [Athelia sp. TMB]|nr:hypothetical protein HWV62_26883 [Athelia sp. TMB]